MSAVNLTQLRRLCALRGLTPASEFSDVYARSDEAAFRPARLEEDARLEWHPVGPAEPWVEPVAFLDGIQQVQPVAYAGPSPVFAGEIAAAVRERQGGALVTVLEERRLMVIARPAALAAVGDLAEQFRPVGLPAEGPHHPARDLAEAGRVLDRARVALELEVAARYRERSASWLIVDGTLTDSPVWATDTRMIGIARSHASLPFDGSDLDRFLRLPAGHRSSVYVPETRHLAPVREWALRLWPWEGKDVFHGLVRVVVAPPNGDPGAADALSRRLLAERAPISTPVERWDRLLYGIHSVHSYLRARRRLS
jgi:hypothetical protein